MKRMRRGPRHGGGGGGSGGGFRPQHSGNSGGNQPLNRNHVFDSQGPDLRVRGTAQQLFEKYLQLGRDATSSGDRVAAEGYFQHAEHYFRILGAMNAAQQQSPPGGGGGGGHAPQPRQPQPPRYNGPEEIGGDQQELPGAEYDDSPLETNSLAAELAAETEQLVAPPAPNGSREG